MRKGRRVLVTGATGFIGFRLATELIQGGQEVVALARGGSQIDGLETPSSRLARGDLLDPASLRQAMTGCQDVYHLAAYAKNWARQKDTFFRLNVEGARNVLAAAQAARVERVLFASSIVTFGPTAPGVVGDESQIRAIPRFLTEYEESKAQAEQEALCWMAKGLDVVIVNPTRVYGPGRLTEGNSVTRLVELYATGRLPFLLNRGQNVGNYVLVDDLVRGMIQAVEKGRAGQRYILGGENVSLKRFFELVDEAAGGKHRQFNLPPWVAMAFARCEQLKAQATGRYPRITPGWVETFLHDWTYSSAKAERELGYRSTPLLEGLRATCRWLGLGPHATRPPATAIVSPAS